MTPQQIKAKELVDRFVNIQSLKDFGRMDIELAKECAVICCDDILHSITLILHEYEFWQKVKQEIEKL